MRNIKVGRALSPTSGDINGFIGVYKEAFGGDPYFETYTDDQVREIWDEHATRGRIILARDEDAASRVVGLGCSLPLHKAPGDVQAFLAQCKANGELPDDFDEHNTWYMSELGVLTDYRQQGIAYKLVRGRLIDVAHINANMGTGKYYVMRTAAVRSNSRHLYERMGARSLVELQDVSETEQVTENKSQSVERVYLFGKVSDALDWLTRRLGDEESEADAA